MIRNCFMPWSRLEKLDQAVGIRSNFGKTEKRLCSKCLLYLYSIDIQRQPVKLSSLLYQRTLQVLHLRNNEMWFCLQSISCAHFLNTGHEYHGCGEGAIFSRDVLTLTERAGIIEIFSPWRKQNRFQMERCMILLPSPLVQNVQGEFGWGRKHYRWKNPVYREMQILKTVDKTFWDRLPNLYLYEKINTLTLV